MIIAGWKSGPKTGGGGFPGGCYAFAWTRPGEYPLPGLLPVGGCGDTLADIRGTQRLLLDVMDCPQYVREFEKHLMGLWMDVFDCHYGIIGQEGQGAVDWMGIWAPGRYFTAANDFSYMISPAMYRDIFLPALEMQVKHLDYCLYHVDGTGAFGHVDTLCGIPGLQAIQISPGVTSPLDHMDILRRVQSAGKNLHISLPPEQVEPALEALSSRGLFINTWCGSEEEARQLLNNAEKMVEGQEITRRWNNGKAENWGFRCLQGKNDDSCAARASRSRADGGMR